MGQSAKNAKANKKKPAWLKFKPPMNRAAAVGQRKLKHEQLWRQVEAHIIHANLTDDELAEVFVMIEDVIKKFIEENPTEEQ